MSNTKRGRKKARPDGRQKSFWTKAREERLVEEAEIAEKVTGDAVKQNFDTKRRFEDFYDYVRGEEARNGRYTTQNTYGIVLIAKHRETGRQYHVKMDAVARAEHLGEHARNAANCVLSMGAHPNIVGIVDCFQDTSAMITVQDLCLGRSLFDLLHIAPVLHAATVRSILKQILEALAYVHSKGYVHGNVNSDNVMFVDKERTQVKLSGFDIAEKMPEPDPEAQAPKSGLFGRKQKAAEQFVTLRHASDPEFVAPERIGEAKHTAAVDVWGVGCLMHLMLTGYPAYFGSTDEEVLAAIKRGGLTFDTPAWRGLPPAASNLCGAMLASDAAARITAVKALEHAWFAQGKYADA